MGINFDELKNKAQAALDKHGDKIEQGLDKASGFAKSKLTGHDEQIDGVTEKAKSFLHKDDGSDQEQPPPPAR
jgi:hypothetical protein